MLVIAYNKLIYLGLDIYLAFRCIRVLGALGGVL